MKGQFAVLVFLLLVSALPVRAETYCYNGCQKNSDCPKNTACIDNLCRNPLCSSVNTCTCPLTTPTLRPQQPTTYPTTNYPQPTPTPVINKGGSESGSLSPSPTGAILGLSACYQPCSSADACAPGLTCFAGSCRNPICLTSTNCDCTSTPATSPSLPTTYPTTNNPPPTSLPMGRIILVTVIWLLIMSAIIYLVRRSRRLSPPTPQSAGPIPNQPQY